MHRRKQLKRADGEGTLSKRRAANGKVIGYKGAVTIGLRPDGRVARRWVSGTTEAEVRAKMESLKNARNTGMLTDAENMTVSEYLERWIAYKRGDGTRIKTTQRYGHTVSKWLQPLLGRIRLERLRPLDVEAALSHIREQVSAKEARRSRITLSMALNQAVRWQILPRNVCQAVRPPAIPHEEEKEIRFWTPNEVRRFLGVARQHRHYALFYTGLMTGLRTCELLGLRWRDVHLQAGFLRVEQDAVSVQGKMILGPVKTRASRRTVTISSDTVATLEEHRARQRVEKQNAQEGYEDHDLVFASEVGTVTNYQNLRVVLLKLVAIGVISDWQQQGLVEATEPRTTERYRTLLLEQPALKKRVCIGNIGLHGLRHTHASILIRRGVNAKVVSERLGHTSVAFTLKTYAHCFDEQHREAAMGMDEFLGDAGTPDSL